MIEDDLAQQARNAFYMGPDHETLIIDQAQAECFWRWFQENSSTFRELATPGNLHDQRYLAGRCFGNAQAVAISEKFCYLEGFASRDGSFIFHGFNVYDGSVVDVSVLNHPDDFEIHFGSLPNLYIGVEIPLEFVNQINGIALDQNNININPLLYSYYIESLRHL